MFNTSQKITFCKIISASTAFRQFTCDTQNMSDWLKTPVQWAGDHKSLLLSSENTPKPTPDANLDQIIKKSSQFPIKFPVDTPRCCELNNKTSKDSLEKNINSAYPIIHEHGLYLCSLFLLYQRKFSQKSTFYQKSSLLQLIDRLLNKRAVLFMNSWDQYLLLNGESGTGNWETIGTETEKEPLVLEKCLSYDEIKLSALLSVSSHTVFLNDGDRNNRGKYEEDRSKVEENGVIVGLIGPRLEKQNVMEYQEIMKTKTQNQEVFGYGDGTTLRNLFLKFFGGSCGTYEELEDEVKRSSERYIEIGKDKYFDKVAYEKRLSLSIDTLLLEANHRAFQESKKAFVHVVGIGLGVWKIHQQQNKIFMDTFAHRLEILSETLTNVSDIRFAYIGETRAGKYKNGDNINGITLYMENKNPQEKLKDDGKLLVVSYPWDGNAFPGNEFWIGSLNGSGDPAAACSTQVTELHNGCINGKVSGGNLRVATAKGVVTFEEYQELHRND